LTPFQAYAFTAKTANPRVVGARWYVWRTCATGFVRESAEAAGARTRPVADQLWPKFSKIAGLMDDAGHEVLAFMSFPKAHHVQIRSTNPLEELNAAVKRGTDVIHISER